VTLPVRSRDEVGELTEAFNAMSGAIRQKLMELQAVTTVCMPSPITLWLGKLVCAGCRLLWVNPSVERLTGYTPAECKR